MDDKEVIKLFVCGDVMTGRGIDQILSSPGKPTLYESHVQDARDYIALAESISGKIPRQVSGDYLWKDALKEWEKRKPHLKLINLETSITSADTPWENKGIHYRMHPKNINALTSAKFDVCALANNHVMDWGVAGLLETTQTLKSASIQIAGAGETISEAQSPAIIPLYNGKRCLIFSMGIQTCGIPPGWQARENRAGVWLLNQLSAETVNHIKERVDYYRKPGDFCIISIHWGGNWGYQIPAEHQEFAKNLIDETGINLLHGHSSHHPQAIEIYKNTPILYGCGDFLNDYEGISGYGQYKAHLSLMYFLEFDPHTLWIKRIELVPMEMKRFSLHYTSTADFEWMFNKLKKNFTPFRTDIKLSEAGQHCLEVNVYD